MVENPNKVRFLKVFDSLPPSERLNPVVVLEPYGPISWDRAYKEILGGTEIGIKIAEKLVTMGII
ncbi:MAG: hypothetical protein V1820_01860 [archaeon]